MSTWSSFVLNYAFACLIIPMSLLEMVFLSSFELLKKLKQSSIRLYLTFLGPVTSPRCLMFEILRKYFNLLNLGLRTCLLIYVYICIASKEFPFMVIVEDQDYLFLIFFPFLILCLLYCMG